MTMKTSYTAGHFELVIDDSPTTAYLKSIDGGWTKHALVDEPIGPHNERIKHPSVADIDPISFDFGLSGANSVLKWIQDSWRKDFKRRSGQIIHADFNLQSTFEHHFSEALITETTFPALDGGSKEAEYTQVKSQPETVGKKKSDGKSLTPTIGRKQKMWLCSGFRLNIDGVDGMEYANKIESFTIKQGVKKLYTGVQRFPELMPTKLEFPNLTGTISAAYAENLLKWHDKEVGKGQFERAGKKGKSGQAGRTGTLEFLSPDKAKTLFRINLSEIGLLSANFIASTANSDQIKRVKFELYIGQMDLDGAGALGLE